MAIFSDLELMGIMNEADDKGSYKDTVKKNARDLKDKSIELGERAKNNTWIGKKMANKKSGTQTVTFKEDADGNIVGCSLEEAKKANPERITRDLTNKTAVNIEKQKQ